MIDVHTPSPAHFQTIITILSNGGRLKLKRGGHTYIIALLSNGKIGLLTDGVGNRGGAPNLALAVGNHLTANSGKYAGRLIKLLKKCKRTFKVKVFCGTGSREVYLQHKSIGYDSGTAPRRSPRLTTGTEVTTPLPAIVIEQLSKEEILGRFKNQVGQDVPVEIPPVQPKDVDAVAPDEPVADPDPEDKANEPAGTVETEVGHPVDEHMTEDLPVEQSQIYDKMPQHNDKAESEDKGEFGGQGNNDENTVVQEQFAPVVKIAVEAVDPPAAEAEEPPAVNPPMAMQDPGVDEHEEEDGADADEQPPAAVTAAEAEEEAEEEEAEKVEEQAGEDAPVLDDAMPAEDESEVSDNDFGGVGNDFYGEDDEVKPNSENGSTTDESRVRIDLADHCVNNKREHEDQFRCSRFWLNATRSACLLLAAKILEAADRGMKHLDEDTLFLVEAGKIIANEFNIHGPHQPGCLIFTDAILARATTMVVLWLCRSFKSTCASEERPGTQSQWELGLEIVTALLEQVTLVEETSESQVMHELKVLGMLVWNNSLGLQDPSLKDIGASFTLGKNIYRSPAESADEQPPAAATAAKPVEEAVEVEEQTREDEPVLDDAVPVNDKSEDSGNDLSGSGSEIRLEDNEVEPNAKYGSTNDESKSAYKPTRRVKRKSSALNSSLSGIFKKCRVGDNGDKRNIENKSNDEAKSGAKSATKKLALENRVNRMHRQFIAAGAKKRATERLILSQGTPQAKGEDIAKEETGGSEVQVQNEATNNQAKVAHNSQRTKRKSIALKAEAGSETKNDGSLGDEPAFKRAKEVGVNMSTGSEVQVQNEATNIEAKGAHNPATAKRRMKRKSNVLEAEAETEPTDCSEPAFKRAKVDVNTSSISRARVSLSTSASVGQVQTGSFARAGRSNKRSSDEQQSKSTTLLCNVRYEESLKPPRKMPKTSPRETPKTPPQTMAASFISTLSNLFSKEKKQVTKDESARGVSFSEQVQVVHIPHYSQFTKEDKANMHWSRDELFGGRT